MEFMCWVVEFSDFLIVEVIVWYFGVSCVMVYCWCNSLGEIYWLEMLLFNEYELIRIGSFGVVVCGK